jgi:hypothetical protein
MILIMAVSSVDSQTTIWFTRDIYFRFQTKVCNQGNILEDLRLEIDHENKKKYSIIHKVPFLCPWAL